MAMFGAPATVTPKYRTGPYQERDQISMQLFETDPKDVNSVKAALSAGAKPLLFRDGTTALHKACEANAVESVKLMIASYVADSEAQSSSAEALGDLLGCRTDAIQSTPLLSACGAGALETSVFLLSKSADPKVENSYGSTCVHLAAGSGGSSATDLCRHLLSAGAVSAVPNHRGSHALHFAVTSTPSSEAVKVIELLADSPGINMNAQDHKGNTALHVASTVQSVDIIEVLLKRGVDPTTTDAEGRTALDKFEVLTMSRSAVSTDQRIRTLLGGSGPAPMKDQSGETKAESK